MPERYRGIGVRIEEDVIVTAEGCRVMTAALPSEASAIEARMAELAQPSSSILPSFFDARRALSTHQ